MSKFERQCYLDYARRHAEALIGATRDLGQALNKSGLDPDAAKSFDGLLMEIQEYAELMLRCSAALAGKSRQTVDRIAKAIFIEKP
jgi:hypothetical protein